MYGTRYIFSKDFFRAWVVVTFLIGWAASLVIVIMPLWQGRHTLKVFWKYVTGGGSGHPMSTAGLTRESMDEAVRTEELPEKDGAKV